MIEQALTDPSVQQKVEVIMDVDQLIRAWIAKGMRTEDIVLQMLHHLNSNEEEHENYRHQFVDLERRNGQMASEIAALKRELKGVREWL